MRVFVCGKSKDFRICMLLMKKVNSLAVLSLRNDLSSHFSPVTIFNFHAHRDVNSLERKFMRCNVFKLNMNVDNISVIIDML